MTSFTNSTKRFQTPDERLFYLKRMDVEGKCWSLIDLKLCKAQSQRSADVSVDTKEYIYTEKLEATLKIAGMNVSESRLTRDDWP